FIKLMKRKLGSINLMRHYADYRIYKRKYNKSNEEINLEYRRFMEYRKNLKEIRRHNERYKRNEETYELGINHLADLLPEEFDKLLGFKPKMRKNRNDSKNVVNIPITGPLPKQIDWRDVGAVTGVKDQVCKQIFPSKLHTIKKKV
ncbi:unnamed protein product, partial [Onchocerca ochengi]